MKVKLIFLFLLSCICSLGGNNSLFNSRDKQSLASQYLDATNVSVFGEYAMEPSSAYGQSENLKQCIQIAREQNSNLFIPSGEYILLESITSCFYDIKITGDSKGCTVLKNGRTDGKAIEFGAFSDYSKHNDIEFSNLFFDGIDISFRKPDNSSFYNNVFYNCQSSFMLYLQAGNNININNNIFLRDYEHISGGDPRCIYVGGYGFGSEDEYGKTLSFAENINIRNNIIGAKIDELDELSKSVNKENRLNIKRLQNAISNRKISLANNQNHFKTSINSFYCLKNAYIENNYFYSCYDDYFDASTNKSSLPFSMDHVTYIRWAQNVFMSGNYSKGWHNGQAGGFKFKSSNNVAIVDNYFCNTGIIMSNHAEQGCVDIFTKGGVSELKNWLIADNVFDFRQSHGAYGTGIYFELDNPDKVKTVVEDIVIINNKYENYKNYYPSSMRLEIRFGWTDKEDGTPYFTPENTCLLNNYRDDTDSGFLGIDPWKEEDYKRMRTDWHKMLSDVPEIEKYYEKVMAISKKTNIIFIIIAIIIPLFIAALFIILFYKKRFSNSESKKFNDKNRSNEVKKSKTNYIKKDSKCNSKNK